MLLEDSPPSPLFLPRVHGGYGGFARIPRAQATATASRNRLAEVGPERASPWVGRPTWVDGPKDEAVSAQPWSVAFPVDAQPRPPIGFGPFVGFLRIWAFFSLGLDLDFVFFVHFMRFSP